MNEANQELLDMFNAGLADIKANGTYDEILAKYLGESKYRIDMNRMILVTESSRRILWLLPAL